jgi:hypothetical protein
MKEVLGYETLIAPPFGPDLDPETLIQIALGGRHVIDSLVISSVQPGATIQEEAERTVRCFTIINSNFSGAPSFGFLSTRRPVSRSNLYILFHKQDVYLYISFSKRVRRAI